MPERVLRMKSSMPFALESKLIHKYGWVIQQRKPGEFIEFVFKPKPADSNVVKFPDPISPERRKDLMTRCDNIVDFFPDPYNAQRAVRTRLHNMSQTLIAAERQFVLEYMDENFPLVDDGT